MLQITKLVIEKVCASEYGPGFCFLVALVLVIAIITGGVVFSQLLDHIDLWLVQWAEHQKYMKYR